MAQNSFIPNDKNWILKERTFAAAVAATEKGDMIQATSGGITVALGTNSATAIIGIAAEDSAYDAAARTIRVWEPTSIMSEFKGQVTDGAIAVGLTDSGRPCDLEDHEGIDTDTDSEHSFIIVRGLIATADGSSTAGRGVFRIAQTEQNLSSF